MKTCLYRDKLWMFKSGIATAFQHQQIALRKSGVEVTTKVTDDSQIVHFNWYSPLSLKVMKWARAHGKKVVVFAHTANDLRESSNYAALFEPMIRRYLARFYSMADLLIAPSEYCRRLITGAGYNVHKRVHVISNGVDTEKFVFSEEKRQRYRERYKLTGPTVITAAQFIPRKGVVDFFEVARRMPEFTFVWFGPIIDRWLSFSQSMVREMKTKPDNLIVAGFVDDIVAALCCGDIFLFPSYEENEGIALLEACCVGLPVVLRPLAVYRGWLTHGVNCLGANSVDGFVSAIRSVHQDAALRTRLSTNAKKMAMGHNLKAVGDQILKAYQAELGIEPAFAQWYQSPLAPPRRTEAADALAGRGAMR